MRFNSLFFFKNAIQNAKHVQVQHQRPVSVAQPRYIFIVRPAAVSLRVHKAFGITQLRVYVNLVTQAVLLARTPYTALNAHRYLMIVISSSTTKLVTSIHVQLGLTEMLSPRLATFALKVVKLARQQRAAFRVRLDIRCMTTPV